MGDWNMTPEEMQKTELMRPTGAVMKTPPGVEFTCSSGNRLMDYALIDRRLESVVKVKPFWAVPWRSHVALQISILRARRTHTMRIVCMPRKFSLGKTENKVACNENCATQQGRAGETHYAHWVPLRLLHGWSQKRNAELG